MIAQVTACRELFRTRVLLSGYLNRVSIRSEKRAKVAWRWPVDWATRLAKGGSRLRAAYEFEKDYTALLLSLATGIRTGLDPLSSLTAAEGLFSKESELGKQLKKLNAAIYEGQPEDELIMSFAEEIDHPDLKLFRTAFLLARQEGSSLAISLERLASVTRERQSFRRKTRAAVAMQRLSSIGISCVAALILIIQYIGNPNSIHSAFGNPLGRTMLSLGGLLLLSGIGWMMALTRTRI